jgi:hypothetical protein
MIASTAGEFRAFWIVADAQHGTRSPAVSISNGLDGFWDTQRLC